VQDLDLRKKNNINFNQFRVVRIVDETSEIPLRTVVVDRGNEHLVKEGVSYVAVPVDNTWIVVQQWENRIFVDQHGKCYLCSE